MARLEAASLLLPENVPLGGALCLLSCCLGFGIQRLSLRNGTPIGELIGSGCCDAVQISENEIATATSVETTVDVVTSGQQLFLAGYDDSPCNMHHALGGHGVAFLPQSQLLVSGGDEKVVVWNQQSTANGDDGSYGSCGSRRSLGRARPSSFAVKCQLEGHTGGVTFLDALKEGQRVVVSGSVDDTARVWDVCREECVSVLQGHSDWVYGLCHDFESKIQFTGSDDNTVIAWDFRAKHQKIVQLDFPDSVRTLCYRPNQSQLVVPCRKGPIRVIDIRMLRSGNPTTSVINEWNTGHSGNVYGSCCVLDDHWDFFVTSGFRDNHVRAWKESGKCMWDWEAPGGYPWNLSFCLWGSGDSC